MKYTLVIPDDADPVCDRDGCDELWPGPKGREMPGAMRMVGTDEHGVMLVGIYCSADCAELDRAVSEELR